MSRRQTKRRRANGFALTEMLVAVGIGALIVGALVYLQVDVIGWTNRAMAMGRPDPSVRALQTSLRNADRCAHPGAVLIPVEGGLASVRDKEEIPMLGLPAEARGRVRAANRVDGTQRPGWSMAAISRGDATIAVVALRCDLPEVCSYDPNKGGCAGS